MDDNLKHILINFKKTWDYVKEDKKYEEKKEVKEPKQTKLESLDSMTVAELRELAKGKEIKGYSTMKKAELLEALK